MNSGILENTFCLSCGKISIYVCEAIVKHNSCCLGAVRPFSDGLQHIFQSVANLYFSLCNWNQIVVDTQMPVGKSIELKCGGYCCFDVPVGITSAL